MCGGSVLLVRNTLDWHPWVCLVHGPRQHGLRGPTRHETRLERGNIGNDFGREHIDGRQGIRKRETFTRRQDIAGFFGTCERAKTVYQALGLRIHP